LLLFPFAFNNKDPSSHCLISLVRGIKTRLTNRSVGCAHKRTCIPITNTLARKHRVRERERECAYVCEHRLRRGTQKPVADIPPIPGRPNFGLVSLYGHMRYIADGNSWLALGSVGAELSTWTLFRVCLLSFGFIIITLRTSAEPKRPQET
ncbi:hypothetical protein CH063_13123, partial [Colletotrichum higginsianum]